MFHKVTSPLLHSSHHCNERARAREFRSYFMGRNAVNNSLRSASSAVFSWSFDSTVYLASMTLTESVGFTPFFLAIHLSYLLYFLGSDCVSYQTFFFVCRWCHSVCNKQAVDQVILKLMENTGIILGNK